MDANRSDLGAGAVFVGVALLYGGIAWRTLPIGETFSMGPGYFPMVLSGLLGLVGLVLVVRSLRAPAARAQPAEPRPGERIPWRAILAISLAILFFGRFLWETGLFLALFVTSFVASLASERVRLLHAAALALALAVFCIAVFVYGVRLPIPVLGTWFTD